MSVHLFDVNLMIALAWPQHVHHGAAHAWFAHGGKLATFDGGVPEFPPEEEREQYVAIIEAPDE